MTAARLTSYEAQAFLDADPKVQWIDAFLFDMNGVPRGKRIRRSDLVGVAKKGLMMPASVFIMDPLGNCMEETGRLWETGDPDLQCHLLGGTLVGIPVGDGRHAQAVIVVDAKEDLDPRAVLAGQVERFARAAQTPVVAVELEFEAQRYEAAARWAGIDAYACRIRRREVIGGQPRPDGRARSTLVHAGFLATLHAPQHVADPPCPELRVFLLQRSNRVARRVGLPLRWHQCLRANPRRPGPPSHQPDP